MMEGKYKTIGDLKFLMAWDNYFGDVPTPTIARKIPDKKSNMTLFITLWALVWTTFPINAVLGGIVGV